MRKKVLLLGIASLILGPILSTKLGIFALILPGYSLYCAIRAMKTLREKGLPLTQEPAICFGTVFSILGCIITFVMGLGYMWLSIAFRQI